MNTSLQIFVLSIFATCLFSIGIQAQNCAILDEGCGNGGYTWTVEVLPDATLTMLETDPFDAWFVSSDGGATWQSVGPGETFAGGSTYLILGIDPDPADFLNFSTGCFSVEGNGCTTIGTGCGGFTGHDCILDGCANCGTPPNESCENTIEVDCDDFNDCTINDLQVVDAEDNSIICVACAGTPTICDTDGATEVQTCDDNNACTIDDTQVILSCDGSICEPCSGTPLDCDSPNATEVVDCDDGLASTINDMQTILSCDGTVCGPCTGTFVDCDTTINYMGCSGDGFSVVVNGTIYDENNPNGFEEIPDDECAAIQTTIDLSFSPEITVDLEYECNEDLAIYTITLNFSGGQPTLDGSLYSVAGSLSGEFPGGESVILEFAEGSGYEFVVSDNGTCSPVILADNPEPCTKLAIELASFEGRAQENSNLIQWETASETDNERFDLYSSKDGEKFALLASIKGAGTSNLSNSYSFTHQFPNELQYYRLHSVAVSGAEEKSHILSVENTVLHSTSTVFPNPANHILNIVLSNIISASEASIQVYDTNGRIVLQEYQNLVEGQQSIELEIEQLLSGRYFFSISTPDMQVSSSFLKN